MHIVLLVLFMVAGNTVWAQFSEGHRLYLNKQIRYVNESIHGMLVAHRLVEGYNQEINKYVDLPSYKVNDFDNSDLPADLFGETKQWFYEKPPNKLYNELLVDARRTQFPLQSWPLISQLRNITKFVNNERITLGSTLSQERLNQLATIQKVFLGLESMASYYEEFNAHVEALEKALLQPYHDISTLDPTRKQVYTALVEMHYDIKAALRFIKKDNRSSITQILSKIEKERNWLRTCINELASEDEKKQLSGISLKLEEIFSVMTSYARGITTPDEYSMYGPGYYTFNVAILTLTNRYGNGYISEINAFFEENNWRVIHFLEEAHFVKVIYPEKIPREAVYKESSVAPPEIKTPDLIKESSLPEPVQKELSIIVEKPPPPLSVIGSYSFKVDSVDFEVELFDHRIEDGDLISINVNGEWVFENISLEKESKSLKLKADPGSEHYILIRADNEGWRPPNTIGVRYISNGVVKNFFLVRDLKAFQAIEIKYSL